MRRLLAVALVASALVAGAAAFRVSVTRDAARPPSPTFPELPAAAARAAREEAAPGARNTPSPAPEPARAVSLADRLSHLLSSLRRSVAAREAAGLPYTEQELTQVMALEREAKGLEADLAGELSAHPEAGHALFDFLRALEEESVALRIAAAIAPSLGEGVRARLAALLGGGGSPRERRLAIALLAPDPSRSSLLALLHAAQADGEAGLRRAAFEALAWGRPSGDDAALIREVASTRAACEPDPSVRTAALGLTETGPGEPRAAAASRRGR
jgi:hypothetical protein